MTISDLLTLIGILLAIIAFISEKSREYILLKLSKCNLWMIAVAFLYIHFLLSYQWWREKFEFLKVFEFNGFPTNEAWAYILSIVILLYFAWKIFRGKFPLSSKDKLLVYYKKILLKNDIPFLAELVERYHLKEVVEFLNKKKAIKINEETDLWQIRQQEKEYTKIIKGRKLIYGEIIYHNIIINNTFLDNVANINPYLFAEVIQQLTTMRLRDNIFVNRYLKILMTNKNGVFFREIRNNQNLGSFDAYRIEKERPILYALFNDIEVCSVNQAWRGVGEPAIIEMQEEAKKEYSVLREPNIEQENDTVWSFRIKIAIWYFDIMVRQAIVQNIDKHMWQFYYYHFVKVIISNMPNLPFVDSELNKNSRNFDLIEEIFMNMTCWKNVIVKSKNDKLIKSVYDCIGQCIYELSITDKLRDDDKNYLINWVWEDLIETFSEDERGAEIVEKIINIGFEMFKKLSNLFSPDNEKYLLVLKTLWNKRDISKLDGIDGQRADSFKIKVIDELKIKI